MSEQRQNLLEFPCQFPLKVMGADHPDFAATVLSVVQQHAPDTEKHHIDTRASSKGNYLSCTVNIHAQSQAQLDDIYRALTAHPMVKVVL